MLMAGMWLSLAVVSVTAGGAVALVEHKVQTAAAVLM